MAHCKAHQLDMHGFCGKFDCPCIKHNCRFFGEKTNADRIRAMSDEELADWLARSQIDNITEACQTIGLEFTCEEGTLERTKAEVLEWLKQPAEK